MSKTTPNQKVRESIYILSVETKDAVQKREAGLGKEAVQKMLEKDG